MDHVMHVPSVMLFALMRVLMPQHPHFHPCHCHDYVNFACPPQVRMAPNGGLNKSCWRGAHANTPSFCLPHSEQGVHGRPCAGGAS